MRSGARTPEELDTLFEDAFVTRDRAGLEGLFGAGALVVADGCREARGEGEIARLAAALWSVDRTYVADSPRVLQARATALVLAARSTSVVRRGRDGVWRYAISLVSFEHPTAREEQ